MLILFAPSKTFHRDAVKKPLKLFDELLTQSIINEIKSLSKSQFQKAFQLSSNLLETAYDYYHSFDDNAPLQSFSLFKGEAYKSLDYMSLNEIEKSYIHRHVYVIDALYGIIRPQDGIKPYRLDFHIDSKYKNIWKHKVNQYLKSLNQEVLSLTSREFDNLIDANTVPFYELSFIDCKEGVCKRISVLNKQLRGKLLRYLASHQIHKVSDLPEQFEGYRKFVHGYHVDYKKNE
ncbi:Protein of uncharacterised function (DUF328) [Acholeplasma oculi]|uniref:YaaA family protein n=1 Tax=Acholeplasma oculi TaxID=35623 RepID=A0A061ACC4_9MOLU|nr:YaaA family protein [Acholeplasma oculi]CDR31488.1 hypothetical protein, uncharacterised UPF0246 [Acholeplasma oculi]SKC49315.1 hypothetical protein SAMN02745122_1393 [Acholeplasma oculi]SUT92228.1 Protein of uncharacterised function (DUF328) [Acholeplasma oculi]